MLALCFYSLLSGSIERVIDFYSLLFSRVFFLQSKKAAQWLRWRKSIEGDKESSFRWKVLCCYKMWLQIFLGIFICEIVFLKIDREVAMELGIALSSTFFFFLDKFKTVFIYFFTSQTFLINLLFSFDNIFYFLFFSIANTEQTLYSVYIYWNVYSDLWDGSNWSFKERPGKSTLAWTSLSSIRFTSSVIYVCWKFPRWLEKTGKKAKICILCYKSYFSWKRTNWPLGACKNKVKVLWNFHRERSLLRNLELKICFERVNIWNFQKTSRTPKIFKSAFQAFS